MEKSSHPDVLIRILITKSYSHSEQVRKASEIRLQGSAVSSHPSSAVCSACLQMEGLGLPGGCASACGSPLFYSLERPQANHRFLLR